MSPPLIPRTAFSTMLKRQNTTKAACPPPQPCPAACPTSCAQQQPWNNIAQKPCPVSVCVADSNSSSHHSSPIGGAMGGVLGTLAVAILLYYLWHRRQKKREAAAARARADAKERMAAGEAFRPGQKDRVVSGGAQSNNSGGTPKSPGLPGSRSFSEGHSTQEILADEADEEDIEWTEMRPDGLTVYKNPPVDDLATNSKRHSSGAATHLSRITEGMEEEDEWDPKKRASISSRVVGPNGHSRRVFSASSAINLDPSSGNAPRSRRSRSEQNMDPFGDAASEHSSRSSSSLLPVGITEPEAAHRATGAPIVEMQGAQVLRKVSDSSSVPGSVRSRTLAVPSPQPSRPNRAAGLNLRLADGSEPGQIRRDSSATSASGRVMSPAAASSIFQRDSYHQSASPSNDGEQHSLPSGARQFDFMNVDPNGPPVSNSANYSSALQDSGVYSRSGTDGRRLSAQTIGTIGTTASDYVLQAPQIVTVTGPNAKTAEYATAVRVQGKPQMVRLAGSQSPVDRNTPWEKVNDPFGDGAAVPHSSSEQEMLRDHDDSHRRETMATVSSFGVSDYAGTSHGRDSTATFQTTGSFGIPIVDVSKAQSNPLRNPTDLSPIDAVMDTTRQSWVSQSPSVSPSLRSVVSVSDSVTGSDGRQSYMSTMSEASVRQAVLSRAQTVHRMSLAPSAFSHGGNRVSSASTTAPPRSPTRQDRDSSATVLGGGLSSSSSSTRDGYGSGVSSIGSMSILDGVPFSFGESSEARSPRTDGPPASPSATSSLRSLQPRLHGHEPVRVNMDSPAPSEGHAYGDNDDQDPFAEPTIPLAQPSSPSIASLRSSKSNAPSDESRSKFDDLRLRHELAGYDFQLDGISVEGNSKR